MAAADHPTATWKTVLRQHVFEAHALCEDARDRFQAVEGFLGPEMRASGAAAEPNEEAHGAIFAAHYELWEASRALTRAACLMRASEYLALHGGRTDDPATPLASADEFAAEDHPQRDALLGLANARLLAEDAYARAQTCCGALYAAYILLRYPVLPDVDGFLNHQRGFAAAEARSARESADNGAALVGTARKGLPAVD